MRATKPPRESCRRWSRLHLMTPASDDNRAAWEKLRAWEKPFLTAFSDSDPITARGDLFFKRMIPGAKGQPHSTIRNGGHFLQEDQGERFAEVVVDFIRATT